MSKMPFAHHATYSAGENGYAEFISGKRGFLTVADDNKIYVYDRRGYSTTAREAKAWIKSAWLNRSFCDVKISGTFPNYTVENR